jgi:Sucrase/ferredoxin-like
MFAIRSGPGVPWIERGSAERIEQALDLDTGALGRGERIGLDQYAARLFLVCTHGRRDPCCAERGRPVAAAVASAFTEETWESSHIGGDRFAGNLVAFPHGLYLGRLDDLTAPKVARDYVGGEIDLAHHRGRSCFAMDVQAAEHVLRVDRRITGVDAIGVIAVRRDGAMTTVTFSIGSERVEVGIERTEAPAKFLTCHAERPQRAAAYRRIGIRTAGG